VPLREAHETAVSLGARALQEQVETFAQEADLSLGKPNATSERAARPGKPPVHEVLELLAGNRRGPPPDRLLATIVFTDIVGSTALAADLGDSRWRDLLDRHDELAGSS